MRASFLLGLTSLAAIACATPTPAATEITDKINEISKDCKDLTSSISNSDYRETMIKETQLDQTISEIKILIEKNKDKFGQEDIDCMVPALHNAVPSIIESIKTLTGKAKEISEQSSNVVSMVGGSMQDLKYRFDSAIDSIPSKDTAADKQALDAAFDECIAAFPEDDDEDYKKKA